MMIFRYSDIPIFLSYNDVLVYRIRFLVSPFFFSSDFFS